MKYTHGGVTTEQMAQHLKPMCESIVRATEENPILMTYMHKHSGVNRKRTITKTLVSRLIGRLT